MTDELGGRRPEGRGLLDPHQVEERVRRALTAMGGTPRTAFAAGVAQRLAGMHLALPPAEHDQEILAWRPTLDAIWRGLAGDHAGADEVCRALARFYARHQEGGQGAFEGEFPVAASSAQGAAAVTATYYAAQCYLHGCADFAVWAASAATQLASYVAEEDEAWWDCRPAPVRAGDWHKAHPAVQAECARQLHDLRLLADSRDLLGDQRLDRLADRLRLLEALYSTDIGPAGQLHLFDGLPYFWLTGQVPGAVAAPAM
ncbi:MAG TPA: hypothetical protein VFA46_12250 [Actinomycetes bacterium]|jgi:hypothetical protein|nr:hypothetical protein [Actinomycetes bacterium]